MYKDYVPAISSILVTRY